MPVARGRTAPPPSAGRRRLPDVCRRAGFIDRAVPPDTALPEPAFHPDCKPLTSAGDGPRATSIREERAQPNRRAGAHTLADPVGQRKSTGPARMTGYQPDPPCTGRAEMACRRMPAGRKMRGRPAMGRVIAFAAGRPRGLAIVHHFSTPYSCRCLCRQPDFAGAPTIRRRRPCRSDPGSAGCPSRRSSPWAASLSALEFAAEPAGRHVVDSRTSISARSGPASDEAGRTRLSSDKPAAGPGGTRGKLRN